MSFDAGAYWQQRLQERTELADVGYAGLGQPFNAWMYRVRRHVFRNALAPHRERIRTAFDIGSGSGFYIEQWRALGVPEVRGSDLAPAAVERLQRAFPDVPFVQLDIGETADALPAVRADAISAFDVTFHIVDDGRFEQALRNVYELLEPGGIFVFSDNFVHGPEQRREHHVSRSASRIDAAVTGAGFKIVARHPSFVLMNEPVDAPRALHRRAWSRLTRTLARRPALGQLIGALLYPAELAALRLAGDDGPSTEVMVCRRPTAPG
ncbi:MAG TPA: class I SAM-dependent methyltransferase [Solirubrobacteraceae bacterium]|jgi:SAM-dependent methyltransferase|nr:class I SAM-dependent methyltransferase [Solirubrobacteraceae bacterium]